MLLPACLACGDQLLVLLPEQVPRVGSLRRRRVAAVAVDGRAVSEMPTTAAVNAAPRPRRRDSRWVIPKSFFCDTRCLIESTGAHGVLLSGIRTD